MNSLTQVPRRQGRLTEFLVLRVLPNEIRTLQGLMTYALDDSLHGLDVAQFCCYEKSIHLIHLRKERANAVVTSRLVDNSLTNVGQVVSLVNVQWADL